MKIRGYVEYIVYPRFGLDRLQSIQFAVFNIKCVSIKKIVKCVGKVPFLSVGDYMEFDGEMDKENSFQLNTAIRVDDDDLGAISMLTYVFGPKTAIKVMKAFNDDAMLAWNTFKDNEQRFYNCLENTKGIGQKTIEKAYLKYENHIAVDVIFNKFSKYGLSLNKSLQIYDKYGEKTLETLKENPYTLVNLDKIPFDVIDRIAQGYYKIDKLDEKRISAGIIQTLKSINTLGHTFMRLNEESYYGEPTLLNQTQSMLHVDKALVRDEVINLARDKKIVLEKQGFKDIVYLPALYKAEKGVATMVKNYIAVNTISDSFINSAIENFEKVHSFKLADKQKEAISTSVKNQFSIISGPPGSGKTTIMDVICEIFTKLKPNVNIKLAAPTGKAAKRISESTHRSAETVHRLLRYLPVDNAFTFNENNPLDADVLIVDEFSMMGISLTNHLLKAIPQKCCVIFVGDKEQLPSVDAGQVLEDLLSVSYIPKVILNKIYRQKDDSTILQRALDLSNETIPNLEDTKDFIFWDEEDVSNLKDGLIELYFKEVEKYGIENVLLLTPQNKGDLGVDSLNECIQSKYNPSNHKELKSGKRMFRVKDRVIQLTNEDDFGVFNGMVGTITDIIVEDSTFETRDTIVVDYGDAICEYTRERFDNIKHAYAMTIHKCQGSEAKSVLIVCHSLHKYMLRKKLIYTGMTRAKNMLQFVGEKKMIAYAVEHNKEPVRNSKLCYWMK